MKYKKSILKLGVLVPIALPIVAVVSCGDFTYYSRGDHRIQWHTYVDVAKEMNGKTLIDNAGNISNDFESYLKITNIKLKSMANRQIKIIKDESINRKIYITIYFNDLELKTFPQKIFDLLDVLKNPNIKFNISLNNNHLQSFDFKSLPATTISISLKNNEISVIDLKQLPTEIYSINLENNKVNTLSLNFIKTLVKNKRLYVDLKNNKITSLDYNKIISYNVNKNNICIFFKIAGYKDSLTKYKQDALSFVKKTSTNNLLEPVIIIDLTNNGITNNQISAWKKI